MGAGEGVCFQLHLPVFVSSGARSPCEWAWAGRSLQRPGLPACPLPSLFPPGT